MLRNTGISYLAIRSLTLALGLCVALATSSERANAAIPKPKAPTALTATRTSTSQVILVWNDLNSAERGYEVQRSSKAAIGFKVIATLPTNSVTYTDNTATNFYYRVRAYTLTATNRKVYSRFSPVASVVAVVNAPVITQQPSAQIVNLSSSATFSVTATGTGTLSYQWQRNGVNVPGYSSSYTFTPSASDHGALYRCIVSNATGATTSQAAVLTVRVGASITAHPASISVIQGQPAAFSVTATGTTPLSYQWQKNGTNIAGATSAGYSVSALKTESGAQFRCVVSNVVSSVTSNSAVLTVPNQPPAANAGPDRSGMINTSLSFSGTASTDPDGTINSYSWLFGDGGTGTGATVNHTYTATGAFEVRLTVTDDNGATATDTAIATVSADSGSWAENFGGSAADGALGMATDSNGDIVVAGYFTGTANFGGTPLVSAGLKDIFVAKYSHLGGHVWSRRFGGAGDDLAYAVAVDSNGDLTVAGEFSGTVNFGGSAFASAGYTDLFIAALRSNDGSHRWSKHAGSVDIDRALSLAIDPSNNVVVTGFYSRTINLGGSDLSSTYDASDIFVAKYSSAGTHVWSRGVWGSGTDHGLAIDTDNSGNVVLTGMCGAKVDFGGGQIEGSALSNIYLAKLSGSNGAEMWAKQFGTANDDIAKSVNVDAGGNILLTGNSRSTIDFGGGALSTAGIYVAKFNSNGQHTWSKALGGGLNEGRSILGDVAGNVYVTGLYDGTINFGGATAQSISNSKDIFLVKYSPTGSYLWSQSSGSTAADFGSQVALGDAGKLVVAGGHSGSGSYAGIPLSSAGSTDVLLMTLSPSN